MNGSEPMADPLSITTGVLGLLGTCITVGSTLKDFCDGASFADTKVKGLLTDVESFIKVLRLMNDTFEQEQIQTSMQATGHIGSHWNNLSASIRDGQNTALQLQETLERIKNKSVGVLDGARKHLRLKGASEEIGNFRLQIQSYRDTLQLSLQTVLLWNQITFKESTDKILPNLNEINQAIRRIAHDINNRMSTSQNAIISNQTDAQISALHNLRNCVQSAASVVSSASTTLGVEQPDPFSNADGSEFGGLFPSEPGETLLRWISSNTIYEFEEETVVESSSKGRDLGAIFPPMESQELEQSDSDNELEGEILQALIKVGREKFQAKDFKGAERLLRNCLDRISSNRSMTSLRHIPRPKSDATNLLLDIYQAQEKWDEARSLLLEKITIESRDKTSGNSCALTDMLKLIDILVKKTSYAEAYLYGRRTLKGYRKMGSDGLPGVESSLKALIHICHMNGNYDEEEAYAATLSNFKQLNESNSGATTATQSNASRPESSFQRTNPPDPPEVREQEANMSEVDREHTAADPKLSVTGSTETLLKSLTPEKADYYVALFKKSGPWHGFLQEEQAKSIFSNHSGLPDEILGEIWNLADSPQKGHLQVTEFVIAMHLLASVEKGEVHSLPKFLPAGLYKAANLLIEPSTLSSTFNEEETTSKSVSRASLEVMPLSQLDGMPPNQTKGIPQSRFKSDESLLPSISAMSVSSNQSALLGVSPNSVVLNPVQSPVERIDSVTSEEPVPKIDRYHNYSDSRVTAEVPATVFSLTDTSSSTLNPNTSSHSAETPNTAELHRQSREPPTIGEASDVNKHHLRTGFAESGFAKKPAVLEKERSSTDTRGQASRDSVAVASNIQWTVSELSKVVDVRRKLLIVGDPDCGKTALLMAISNKNRVFQNRRHSNSYGQYFGDVEIEVEEKLVSLELWDTKTSSIFDGLRSQIYSGTHVILMCFAIDSRDSFDGVQDKWIGEMSKYCEGVPVLLVGCKKDLRGDYKAVVEIGKNNQKQVTYEEGLKVRRRMEAWYTYLECSAKTDEGIREVFEYAARATLSNWKSSKEEKPGLFRRMFSKSSS